VGGLGCGFSVVASVFALIGLIPFLGWLNWITTLPLAILAIIFSGVALTQGERGLGPSLGLIGGVILLFWAAFRLSLGAGII
jgi:hypothetical protein